MICKKCGNSFYSYITIDNKQRHLSSRKYCLDCSPFGKHNTKKLDDESKRSKNNKTTPNKRRKIKAKLIEFKGGKCEKCGYDKCHRALVFHHIDPSQKRFGLGSSHIRAYSKLIEEVKKCMLLCSNCHAELHDELES